VQIPGRLSETTLGDVLGKLLRARVTGLLRLQQVSGPGAGRSHGIYLSRGEVMTIDTEARVPTLGEILSQRGLLDGAAQRRLTQRLGASHPRKVGELLVEEGRLGPDVIGAALRRQLRAKLEVLFGLQEAVLSFHVACPPPESPAPPLSPREFLHGRRRARDGVAGASPSSAHSLGAPADRKRNEALATLGLGQGATTSEVRRAFRRLATQMHPDRHVHASDAERRALAERFAELSVAYHAIVS
jgi:hypothetical protein